jgi:hypothetical protein
MNDTQIVLLVLPVIVIELGLLVVALRDLLRPERLVRYEQRLGSARRSRTETLAARAASCRS